VDESRKVAIITGSARGVGAATARVLAGRGFNVVINYSRNEAGALEVAKACADSGGETLVCRADVSVDEDCRRMVDETMRKWGRLDALVNNAGTTKYVAHHKLEDLTKDDFLRLYSVNVVGPFQMIRAAAPHMKQLGKASIVNIGSLAGITGMGSSIAYSASKAALHNMTVTLARVLGPEIRINAVCPGFIQGEWGREGLGPVLYEKSKSYIEGKVPLKITATPEQIAKTVLYFIEDAALVTGETLLLDGGQHLV
jgi:3-oxoacyl-[acyl-carrier protein] reductase